MAYAAMNRRKSNRARALRIFALSSKRAVMAFGVRSSLIDLPRTSSQVALLNTKLSTPCVLGLISHVTPKGSSAALSSARLRGCATRKALDTASASSIRPMFRRRGKKIAVGWQGDCGRPR